MLKWLVATCLKGSMIKFFFFLYFIFIVPGVWICGCTWVCGHMYATACLGRSEDSQLQVSVLTFHPVWDSLFVVCLCISSWVAQELHRPALPVLFLLLPSASIVRPAGSYSHWHGLDLSCFLCVDGLKSSETMSKNSCSLICSVSLLR